MGAKTSDGVEWLPKHRRDKTAKAIEVRNCDFIPGIFRQYAETTTRVYGTRNVLVGWELRNTG